MNIYDLNRNFVDFSFENPSKIKPNHYALYFFAIEHCNRLGWKKEFGLPTTMTMEAIGIRSYNTYIKTFNELVEFGFFNLIEKSKNQYSSNIIALSNFNKALDKALDKAFIKHTTKQSESTEQSIDSIDKQIYNTTNKQINKYTKREFLFDWNMLRTKHLKKPSFLNSLNSEGESLLKDLSKDYDQENIKNAMVGLFKQKQLPNGNTTMQSNPMHFLKYFNSYLTAFHDANDMLYGKIEK